MGYPHTFLDQPWIHRVSPQRIMRKRVKTLTYLFISSVPDSCTGRHYSRPSGGFNSTELVVSVIEPYFSQFLLPSSSPSSMSSFRYVTHSQHQNCGRRGDCGGRECIWRRPSLLVSLRTIWRGVSFVWSSSCRVGNTVNIKTCSPIFRPHDRCRREVLTPWVRVSPTWRLPTIKSRLRDGPIIDFPG